MFEPTIKLPELAAKTNAGKSKLIYANSQFFFRLLVEILMFFFLRILLKTPNVFFLSV